MKCLVFAPGIMGTQLDDPLGNVVWPPTAWEYLTGYGKVDELIRSDLVPSRIIYKVFIKSVYKTILDDIRNHIRYTEDDSEKRFIPFPYDWRRSNSDSAHILASVLDEQFAMHEGPLEINMIGHSMGGLVIRYLIESGEFSGKPWFDKIRNVITLGTPHLGAPKALLMLQGKEGMLGLSGDDIKTLANDPRYPAVFQLVPPTKSGMTIAKRRAGSLPKLTDPFRSEISNRFGFNSDNIESARDFWEKLDIKKRPKHVEYFCFGGGYHETIVANEYLSANVDPKEMKVARSGDETVPVLSAIPPELPHRYAEKEHSVIFEDRKLRRFLFEFFEVPSDARPFSAGTLEAAPEKVHVGISLGKPVYVQNETVELLISYSQPVSDPSETIQVAQIDESGDPVEDGFRKEVSYRFRGAKISNFALKLSYVFPRGLYKVSSVTHPSDDPTDTILVIRGDES